ncbi:uncharacterized protein BKCO1_790001 [Diplodia corticola]|uniref:DUF1746 domain-containing protein n=1 Tax=Diplodia corticola TaxID=236234 RepID=A0A1J9RLW0_9PEZI|nr:uncharacterized protein BKCO1_790001 [Diplodia corticola]OJD29495.1 hypothetical protein BKCO1_790001 [Diplodia corticola]
MSDDASPPTADWPRRHHDHDATDGDGPGAPDETVGLADQKKKMQSKRIGYLDDLLRSLDILIYAEISAVYYLDCSFLRFVLRAFVQLIWLTPKPEILPELPSNRPYIYPISGSNLICLFCHLWFPPQSAGEATRGYLHGGLLIDWIGQQGPSSKLRLFLLDCFILALQVVMLAATLKLQKVKKRRRRNSSSSISSSSDATTREGGDAVAEGPSTTTTTATRQDVDSEERGILRRSSTLSTTTMQDERTPDERDELLGGGDAALPASSPQAALDALNSGQAVVAELFIFDTVRDQIDVALNPTAAGTAAEAASRPAVLTGRDRRRQLAAALARRRLALATRFGAG